jgi:hypothetical protein
MNTETIADLTIAVDYGASLLNMIAAGHYGWVSPKSPLNASPSRAPPRGSPDQGLRELKRNTNAGGMYLEKHVHAAMLRRRRAGLAPNIFIVLLRRCVISWRSAGEAHGRDGVSHRRQDAMVSCCVHRLADLLSCLRQARQKVCCARCAMLIICGN